VIVGAELFGALPGTVPSRTSPVTSMWPGFPSSANATSAKGSSRFSIIVSSVTAIVDVCDDTDRGLVVF
jgi:hypothetical protein